MRHGALANCANGNRAGGRLGKPAAALWLAELLKEDGSMREDVLAALHDVGCWENKITGTVRLYHATSHEAAHRILADGTLLPAPPEDLAERQLHPGGGSVYLATQPSILDDLRDGDVVLAVDVIVSAMSAEILRPRRGNPPRAELEVRLQPGEVVELLFADKMGRDVGRDDLVAAVQTALGLFEHSKVGQQLSDPDERPGRCRRSSERFVSAIRHVDPDAEARIIEWIFPEAFHNAVVVADGIVVDWTASQFTKDPVEIAKVPWPLITTRAQADALMSLRLQTPHGTVEILPATGTPDFIRRGHARILPWSQVQDPIPADGTEQADLSVN
jgi:hypothetical protein